MLPWKIKVNREWKSVLINVNNFFDDIWVDNAKNKIITKSYKDIVRPDSGPQDAKLVLKRIYTDKIKQSLSTLVF